MVRPSEEGLTAQRLSKPGDERAITIYSSVRLELSRDPAGKDTEKNTQQQG